MNEAGYAAYTEEKDMHKAFCLKIPRKKSI